MDPAYSCTLDVVDRHGEVELKDIATFVDLTHKELIEIEEKGLRRLRVYDVVGPLHRLSQEFRED